MSPICFVISPIGENETSIRIRADKIFSELTSPAAKECGYEATRADQISEPGIITPSIISHLLNDPFAIADLTGRNANVFYELAIRHLSRKPFVMIIEEGEDAPFNVKDMRMLGINSEKPANFKGKLKEFIKNAEQLNRHITTPITQYGDVEVLNIYEGAQNLLPALIFPTMVVRYSLARFFYELKNCLRRTILWHWSFGLAYRCNTQITVLNNQGIILSHTHPTSLRYDAKSHIGNSIWNNFGIELGVPPFEAIVRSPEKHGWILWIDNTYSLIHSNKYTSIKGRDNHRINLAYFSKIKKRIFVLEIHQELDYELEPSLYDIIKNVVIERVKQAEKEFNLTTVN